MIIDNILMNGKNDDFCILKTNFPMKPSRPVEVYLEEYVSSAVILAIQLIFNASSLIDPSSQYRKLNDINMHFIGISIRPRLVDNDWLPSTRICIMKRKTQGLIRSSNPIL